MVFIPSPSALLLHHILLLSSALLWIVLVCRHITLLSRFAIIFWMCFALHRLWFSVFWMAFLMDVFPICSPLFQMALLLKYLCRREVRKDEPADVIFSRESYVCSHKWFFKLKLLVSSCCAHLAAGEKNQKGRKCCAICTRTDRSSLSVKYWSNLLVEDLSDEGAQFFQMHHCASTDCNELTLHLSVSNLKLEDLTEEGVQMLRYAQQFVDESLYTTLWLQYDAPTIALGIFRPSLTCVCMLMTTRDELGGEMIVKASCGCRKFLVLCGSTQRFWMYLLGCVKSSAFAGEHGWLMRALNSTARNEIWKKIYEWACIVWMLCRISFVYKMCWWMWFEGCCKWGFETIQALKQYRMCW